MMLLRRMIILLTVVIACNGSTLASATDVAALKGGAAGRGDPYAQSNISLQLLSGALISPVGIGPVTRDFDYWQTNLRIGWMLTDPPPDPSFFRGNVEALLEISNSLIYEGFGDYIGGITGLIRYNFLPADSSLLAYVQAGVGLAYTDAHRDQSQSAIGQALEFTPQAAVGLRYLINKNWSIDAEASFQHMSNGGLADRNLGINAFGGFVGITCYFDSLFAPEPSSGEDVDFPLDERPTPAGGGREDALSVKDPASKEKRRAPERSYILALADTGETLQFSTEEEGAAREVTGAPFVKRYHRPVPAEKRLDTAPLKGDEPVMRRVRLSIASSEGALRVIASAGAPIEKHQAFFLGSPARLVLDLPGRWHRPDREKIAIRDNVVKGVRLGVHRDKLRVVMDLAADKPPVARIEKAGRGLTVTFMKKAFVANRIKIAPLRRYSRRTDKLTVAVR